ncbi:MAG: DUF3298 domain-containing protein [Butyrivibrio sp.]|nr:DUF3298 domain-containing protein [Butyrivibrio sp.]MBE5827205.1 DUF3298 domain-containing protein [Butyrivibrio sp.]
MGKICKKFMIFLLTVVMTAGLLAGCGANSGSKVATKIKIGVTLYDQYDTFISQLMECFTQQASENVEVVVYNASNSQQTQNNQVKKMIEDGCNVICVNLVDRTDPTAVIDAAKKADVPIIFFNRELVEGDMGRWNKLFYVGANAIESGVMEGELAAEAIKSDDTIDRNGDGAIQFVVLEGEAGHQDAIVRTEYSVDTLIRSGVEVDKLGYAIANWNRAQAQTKMSQLIEQNGNSIELVLSNNDDMALGAIDAYETAGVSEDLMPVFFGIDGTDVGLEAVAEGKLGGTVYNDKEGQAGAMYSLALTLAKGGSIRDLESIYNVENGKYIRLPYTKITNENIGEYLKKAVAKKNAGEDQEGKEPAESPEPASSDYPMFKQVTLKYDKYYEGDLVDENYYGDDKEHRLLYYSDEQYLLVTDPYKEAYPELAGFLQDRVLDRTAADGNGVGGDWGELDIVAEYEELVSQGYNFIGPWYDVQRENIALLNDKILSFVTYYENFAGGAHGYHCRMGTTVDVKSGKEYELKEILDVSDEQLRAMIRDRIKIEDADEYEDYWDLDDSLASYYIDPDAANEAGKDYVNHYNWTMDPKGIHFYFNPYDIAAYAFGIIDATVPYDMLGDFSGKDLVEGASGEDSAEEKGDGSEDAATGNNGDGSEGTAAGDNGDGSEGTAKGNEGDGSLDTVEGSGSGKDAAQTIDSHGYVTYAGLYVSSSEWDSGDYNGLSLYYVPGKEGEGLANGLYLKKGNKKASFDESFMMEDESSISTWKVVTGDGREFIYVTSKSFGYYYDFFAFEVTDGELKTCGRAVFTKTGLEPYAYDGEWLSEGAAVDAEHMYFGEINTIIGDFVLVGQYRVGDDGMPVFSGDYKYVTECSDHITLKKGIKADVVDEAGNVITAGEELPDGTHVMPWRTAGDKFVDCYLDDGRIVRISYNRDGDEPDIDGEYLMDIFEGESYVG